MSSKIYDCIEKIGNCIIENKEFLTELDREIGDADHGINMARGFTEVLAVLPKDSDNISEVLKKTGMTLLSKVGGASGPLYGTAYMQAAKACAGKTALAPEDGKAIFRRRARRHVQSGRGRRRIHEDDHRDQGTCQLSGRKEHRPSGSGRHIRHIHHADDPRFYQGVNC